MTSKKGMPEGVGTRATKQRQDLGRREGWNPQIPGGKTETGSPGARGFPTRFRDFIEAPSSFPEAQLEHIWRGGAPLLSHSWLGVDSPFLPEYQEFRRHWEPKPGWELFFSWECTAGGGWECVAGMEEGRASLGPDPGRPPWSL